AAALGIGARPALTRASGRRVSSSFCQVPSPSHAGKELETVFHGGKSWGNARQVHPSRTWSNRALTTSRNSVLRGRPRRRRRVARGSKGSIRAHCWSVRSLGYALRLILHFTHSPNYGTDSESGRRSVKPTISSTWTDSSRWGPSRSTNDRL